MPEVNYCQNLWTQFAKTMTTQQKCAAILDLANSEGEKHIDSLKLGLSNMEIELDNMMTEWNASFVTLENGTRIFGLDYNLLAEIGKQIPHPKPLEMLDSSGYSVNRVSENGRVIKLNINDKLSWPDEAATLITLLKDLERLDISGSWISDMTFLSKLPNLKSLKFSTADSLEPVSELDNIESLGFYSANDTDIMPLQSLKKLKDLSIHFAPNAKFSLPENSWPSLESVEVGFATRLQLSGILASGPIQHLRTRMLRDSDTLDAILGNSTIKAISISECRDSEMDISALSSIPNLERVYISSSKISDLSPLLNLSQNCEISLNNVYARSDKQRDILRMLKEKGAEII